MKKIIVSITLIGISCGAFAQVPNKNETELPTEGSISEGSWGNYLLSDNTTSRTVRLGVSNDGYTRGEIEIENNNLIGSDIIFKTTNLNGGALRRMTIKDNGNIGIGTSNPDYKLEVHGALALKNGNTDLLLYRDTDVGDWSLLRTNTGNGIALIGQPDNVALSVSRTTSNVGIGTTTPDEKLHVNGTATITGNIGNVVGPHWQTGRHTLELQNSDAGDVVLSFHRAGHSNAAIKHPTTGGIAFSANGGYDQTHMYLKSDGYVGIGTTAPKSKLHVNGDLFMNAGEGFRVFGDANYFGNYMDGIIFEMQDVNGSNGNTDGGFVFRGYTPTDNISKDWMVIKSGGNVGIGTTTPDSKLTVKGKIHTQEVKVDLAGAVAPDYVFLEDYNLKTIEEVSQHILEKGHLPNIPSAKQMEKEGINLKEMNLKLLEKIEELTLYIINQEKRINVLEEKIKEK